MFVIKTITRMASLMALLTLAFSANAVVIYNEGVDGDAPVTVGADLGTLSAGFWEVMGSLDGGTSGCCSGPDEFDDYLFTANDFWTLDLTFLNLTGTPSLLTVQLINGSATGAITFDSATGSDIFNGAISAGVWGIRLLPTGNMGQAEYTFAINVGGDVSGVPTPATPLILGLGLILLGLGRRARTS